MTLLTVIEFEAKLKCKVFQKIAFFAQYFQNVLPTHWKNCTSVYRELLATNSGSLLSNFHPGGGHNIENFNE